MSEREEGSGAGAVLAEEPAETRFLRWVFLGSDGLRAGWSIAAFVVVYLLFTGLLLLGYWMVTGTLGKAMNSAATEVPTHLDPLQQGLQESASLIGLLGAMSLMALVERRKLKSFYLTGRRWARECAWGVGSGFVALSALMGILLLGHWVSFGGVTKDWGGAAWYGLGYAVLFAMVALFEEGAFRCYLLFTLERGFSRGVVGFWAAALVSSALFGAIHLSNKGETVAGVTQAAVFGLLCCSSVRWTGSAWWAIGFHAAWDWAQTFFYGTPDSGLLPKGSLLVTKASGSALWSGGATGPEGSLLAFLVMGGVGAGLWAAYGRRKQSEFASLPD